MCESKVILIEDGKKKVVMEAAAVIHVEGKRAVIIDITGNEVQLDDVAVKDMNLMKHEISFARCR
jgi:predicted RNA-binding protein